MVSSPWGHKESDTTEQLTLVLLPCANCPAMEANVSTYLRLTLDHELQTAWWSLF